MLTTAVLLLLTAPQTPPPDPDKLAARVALLEQKIDATEKKVARIDDGIAEIKQLLLDQRKAAAPAATQEPKRPSVKAPASAVPGGRVFVGPGGFWYTESTDPDVVVPYTLPAGVVASAHQAPAVTYAAPAAPAVAAQYPFGYNPPPRLAAAGMWGTTTATSAPGAGPVNLSYPAGTLTGTYTGAPGAARLGVTDSGCAGGACGAQGRQPTRPGLFGRFR